MINILKSTTVGVSTFILEWVAAWVLLLAFSLAHEIWGAPGSYALRQVIAYAGLISIAGGSLLVLAKAPFALGDRFRANVWIALAVAGILSGLTAYWLLLFVSINNDCTVEVSVPYSWIHTCSRSE
jgi:hypothetical protein